MNPFLQFSNDDIIEKVHDALNRLLINDQDLLYIDVAERTIAHKIAEYMIPLFPGWHIDCEYNKDGHEPKRISLPYHPRFNPDNEPTRRVSPDIIVHMRRTTNFLVIELKKSSNKDREEFDFDKVKLDRYIRNLDYRLALFIVINTDSSLGQPYTIESMEL